MKYEDGRLAPFVFGGQPGDLEPRVIEAGGVHHVTLAYRGKVICAMLPDDASTFADCIKAAAIEAATKNDDAAADDDDEA